MTDIIPPTNNKICGIYAIVNKANGHRYIGSSCNIHHRWKGHLLALTRGNHHSAYLQRSWSMWGDGTFEFSVLEECDRSQLAEREQHFIDIFHPEFNACPVAYSCQGLIRSPETIAKLRLIHLGEKQSQESKDKRSATMKGHPYWGRRKHSPETLAKMSATRKGRKMPEEVVVRARANRLLHPVPPEVGRKISATKMGHITTDEAKAKMSAAKMGNTINRGRVRTPETRAKLAAAKIGTHPTRESVEKRAVSMRAYWVKKRLQKENENEQLVIN